MSLLNKPEFDDKLAIITTSTLNFLKSNSTKTKILNESFWNQFYCFDETSGKYYSDFVITVTNILQNLKLTYKNPFNIQFLSYSIRPNCEYCFRLICFALIRRIIDNNITKHHANLSFDAKIAKEKEYFEELENTMGAKTNSGIALYNRDLSLDTFFGMLENSQLKGADNFIKKYTLSKKNNFANAIKAGFGTGFSQFYLDGFKYLFDESLTNHIVSWLENTEGDKKLTMLRHSNAFSHGNFWEFIKNCGMEIRQVKTNDSSGGLIDTDRYYDPVTSFSYAFLDNEGSGINIKRYKRIISSFLQPIVLADLVLQKLEFPLKISRVSSENSPLGFLELLQNSTDKNQL